MTISQRILLMASLVTWPLLGLSAPAMSQTRAPITGYLHTTGADTLIYNSANQPVRLLGFNWSGTESGGRADARKIPDACGAVWRTPADSLDGMTYDNMYQVLRDWGYNVIRLPVSWNNLEPTAPVWNATAQMYIHAWNQTYLNDLKSIVTKAKANGLAVILDMHQDYWSPALHKVTNWDGSRGYCEGVGLPRWLYPSIDVKPATIQLVDFYNAMNWFYRNRHDPRATVTSATPWQLLYSAWDQLSYIFSSKSGFPAYQAVIGADILNEPYFSYVGGSPPAGQTVLQASGSRLQTFYNALAPAITGHNPQWLLFFEDSTGGYNTANPAARETPTMSAKPTVSGQWVYSTHLYNFFSGVFDDGVTSHKDFGINAANAVLAQARAWKVPYYAGEFTIYSRGVDARLVTDAQLEQTRMFLRWAKANNVSWTFWAYVNNYRPMTVIDHSVNAAIPGVKATLDSGL